MAKIGSIGVDVGGTKIRIALFDDAFNVVESIKSKTPKTKAQFSAALKKSVRKLFEKADEHSLVVSALGIGVAGSLNRHNGVVQSAPNIPFLEGFSFSKALNRISRCRVDVHNDVHAALYGEMKLGSAAGYEHVIGVFIGTGIGGAVAIDGKLHLGASGQAGNIGRYLLHAIGPLSGSDRHGILDDFSSRIAIAGVAATLAAKQWAPHLLKFAGTDVRHIKASDLADAIRAGDQSIEELVRSRVRIIGIVLANMVSFLSPEMVVLGGGFTDAMPSLVRDEVAAGIQAHAISDALPGLKIVTAKNKGHAVAVGAAKLALDSGDRRANALVRRRKR